IMSFGDEVLMIGQNIERKGTEKGKFEMRALKRDFWFLRNWPASRVSVLKGEDTFGLNIDVTIKSLLI
ncbi:MAG TPA: hypothetical protein VJ044_19745, partial [Candidatus Hodarchaeales archaeon]|nr:hypothetical protein [Candidatus Hodarchaeales archaeon]